MMISGNRRIPLVYGSSKKTPGFKYDPTNSRPFRIGCGICSNQPPTAEIGPYDWMLIDNTNEVWVSANDFSNLKSTGNTIPLGTDYWKYGRNQKGLWTGKNWLFTHNSTKKVLRSDVNLKTWSEIDGISTGTNGFDMTTNGLNTVVLVANGSNSYISTDNGDTWTNKGNILNDSRGFAKTYYDDSNWIVFSDKNLYLSTDNGSTFSARINVTGDNNDQMLAICRTQNDNAFTVVGRNKSWISYTASSWSSTTIGTGLTINMLGEITHNGTYFVATGLYDGPVWSTGSVWTKWTSTDGSTLTGYDYDYNRLHYNGTVYSYRNIDDNVLYKSSDGKVWSKLGHPVAGRYFVDSYPKIQDKNLNFK